MLLLYIYVINTYLLLGLSLRKDRVSELAEPKNVLMLISDDLRPTLCCYDYESRVLSPNIDQLASRSVKFNNAFVQQALCAPSRTSFLTSRRPDTTRVYAAQHYWRTFAGNFTTLPQYFKDNGYITKSIGKVFHPGNCSGGEDDYPFSWSTKPYHASTVKYKNAKVCRNPDGTMHANLLCPVEVREQPEGTLPDIQIHEYAVETLRNLSLYQQHKKQPFFLAVGFHKPHIPFKYPAEYLDLYPIHNVTPPTNPKRPADMPSVAWNTWSDVRKREDIAALNLSSPYGQMPPDYALRIRQNYYAAMTYMDDLLGKVLQALDDYGFANNTIVSFHGDHGWQLGEHAEWAKYTNYENGLRVPFLVYVPGVTHRLMSPGETFPHINPFEVSEDYVSLLENISMKEHICTNRTPQGGILRHAIADVMSSATPFESDALVELVDLFPTLAELAGLPAIPLCPKHSTNITLCTEGLSFAELICNLTNLPPSLGKHIQWKKAVFSQYPRRSVAPQPHTSDVVNLKDTHIMGYSMRTSHFRYTEWVRFNQTCFCGDWHVIHARELYLHVNDPLEDNNLATHKKYGPTVKKLSGILRKGWKYVLPH